MFARVVLYLFFLAFGLSLLLEEQVPLAIAP